MTTPATQKTVGALGKVFAVAALAEAATWVGLLVGMFLKYVTRTTDTGVAVFGALHGGVFILYVAVAIVTMIALRWPWWVGLLSLLAAIPPLATIPFEMIVRRRGLLRSQSDRSGKAAVTMLTEGDAEGTG